MTSPPRARVAAMPFILITVLIDMVSIGLLPRDGSWMRSLPRHLELSAASNSGFASAIATPPHSMLPSPQRITITSASHTALLSFVPGFMVFIPSNKDWVTSICQTRSMMMAGAMPPAAHIVISAYRPPVRSSSSSAVPMSTAPVAPIG